MPMVGSLPAVCYRVVMVELHLTGTDLYLNDRGNCGIRKVVISTGTVTTITDHLHQPLPVELF